MESCYLELGVHVLEYIAAAAVVAIVVMGSVEIMNGSIDDLVRYSRIGCCRTSPQWWVHQRFLFCSSVRSGSIVVYSGR